MIIIGTSGLLSQFDNHTGTVPIHLSVMKAEAKDDRAEENRRQTLGSALGVQKDLRVTHGVKISP